MFFTLFGCWVCVCVCVCVCAGGGGGGSNGIGAHGKAQEHEGCDPELQVPEQQQRHAAADLLRGGQADTDGARRHEAPEVADQHLRCALAMRTGGGGGADPCGCRRQGSQTDMVLFCVKINGTASCDGPDI